MQCRTLLHLERAVQAQQAIANSWIEGELGVSLLKLNAFQLLKSPDLTLHSNLERVVPHNLGPQRLRTKALSTLPSTDTMFFPFGTYKLARSPAGTPQSLECWKWPSTVRCRYHSVIDMFQNQFKARIWHFSLSSAVVAALSSQCHFLFGHW